MNRAQAFERYWAEFERPLRPAAESVPPAPELAGAVATATALRQHAEAIAAGDLDSVWHSLVARLEESAPQSIGAAERADRRSVDESAGATVTVLRPRMRWTVRAAAAAVAAMVALGTVSLRANPGSALYPVRLTVERAALALSPSDGAIHRRVAEARLDDLLRALRTGPVRAAPGLARSLVVNRAAAGRAGADLADLDLRIALEVPPALGGVPLSIATLVRTILGDLIPAEEAPARGPRPAHGPTDGGPKGKDDNKGRPRPRPEGSNHEPQGRGNGQGREQQGRDDNEHEDPGSQQKNGPDRQGEGSDHADD